ncbi:MAG: hypothetical protein RLZZ595_313 [Bacteroidota bacterium]|jgi:outer membrane protein
MNQKTINSLLASGLVLAIALHFTGNFKNKNSQTSVAQTENQLRVAYVDLDSIQEKYLLYKEKMAEFEKKKESADRDLNGAYQKIENERVAFAQRGQSITQAEYENFQRTYQSKLQNLEEQKRQLENAIANDGMKTMDELKTKMNEFLEVYNKSKGYTYIFSYSSGLNVLFYKDTANNITNEVVAGLNEAYKKNPAKK